MKDLRIFRKTKKHDIEENGGRLISDQNDYEEIVDKITRSCPQINDESVQKLVGMYTSDCLYGTEDIDAIKIEKTTRISIEQGIAINRLVSKPTIIRSLEIGFAYGFSTIWILEGLLNKEDAYHIAIDPFEKEVWRGVGLKQVEKVSNNKIFKWENDFSIQSLTKFILQNEKFDFIFIDGNHRFDDVIVDFYLCDQILNPGGVIAFDDMWMPSIKKATQFIIKNRSYQVIKQEVANMLVIEKLQNDTRKWNHFNDF